MPHPERDFTKRIAAGLKRKSIITPSVWAQNYRIMGSPEPGPCNFNRRPYLRELHDSPAEVNVIRKAAQLGLTETALDVILFHMDMYSRDALYVLPNKGDARDFSAGRFDPAIELSPHIRGMFSDTKNVGHKRAGSANLYIRGGRSASGLKTIPVSVLILDELDEMSKRAVALALERQSGQDYRLTWMISTPTVENFGVSEQFDLSTQEWFYFPCIHCGRQITLRFPDSMEVVGETPSDPKVHESYYKCYECGGKLPQESKPEWLQPGVWVPEQPNRLIRGFALNQMFSPTVSPGQFAISYLKGLSDPADAQEFHNSKCGIPYVIPGGRLTDDVVKNCIGNYTNGNSPITGQCRTIGIDVGGRWLHYEVDEWTLPSGSNDINRDSYCICVEQGKVQQFEEIDLIVQRLGVHFGVVDGQPERRKSYELASRHYGRFAICFYSRGDQGRAINHNTSELKVTVDRTSWIDTALNRFRNKSIAIPADVSLEYREQLTNLVKRYDKDELGNPEVVYMAIGPDHYAHARTYSEIALTTFLPSASMSYNMESPL